MMFVEYDVPIPSRPTSLTRLTGPASVGCFHQEEDEEEEGEEEEKEGEGSTVRGRYVRRGAFADISSQRRSSVQKVSISLETSSNMPSNGSSNTSDKW